VVRFRLTAAGVLAEQGHEGALQVLRGALNAELWTTRRLAAETLACQGHPEGFEALRTGLQAKRRPVKWASAFALARCGNPEGLFLIRRLTRRRDHRMPSYEALARLGSEEGERYLRRVLRRGPAPYDRLRAAVALGLAGDRSGLPLLRERLKKEDPNLGVALALQRLGVPAAEQALRRALEHAALRVQAARALRAYGNVSGVSEMAPLLDSRLRESRLTAAAAIVILTTQTRAEVR
jgi:HEAT repeat protein